MTFKKKAALILIAGVLGSGVLAGCGSTATESQAEAPSSEAASEAASSIQAASTGEKVITYGSTGYFAQESMDPAYSYDGWYWQFEGVLETMFQLDNSYAPQPVLVESYKQIDGKTWEFTLKDAKFHNGEKVTADAVKKCFEHTLEVSDRAAEQIYFDSITADGQVLTIKTKNENPTILNDLCDPLWTVYDADNSDLKKTLYGTGPYMVTSFDPGVEIQAVRFDDYHGGKPKADKIVCKMVGDADALTMALQKGEIDIAAPLPSVSVPVFQGSSSVTIDSAIGTRAVALQFNTKSKTTGDLAVRKAISLCLDRDGIAQQIFAGMAEPSYGVFPSVMEFGGIEGITADVTSYSPEEAAKLLDDAGWVDSNGDGVRDKDGTELNLKLYTFSSRKELASVADVMHSELKEIGINLAVDVQEGGDASPDDGYDLNLSTFVMTPTGNPSYFFNTRQVSGASGNWAGWSNADFDALAKKLEGTADPEERTKLIREACQLIVTDRPIDVFTHMAFVCAYNNYVKDFQVRPSEYYLVDATTDIEK